MAKGKIISQCITTDVIHNYGHRIRRLIVDGVAITHANGSIYVFPWKDEEGGNSVKVIKEDVEVSDFVIQEAKNYLTVVDTLHTILNITECSEEAATARRAEAIEKWRQWQTDNPQTSNVQNATNVTITNISVAPGQPTNWVVPEQSKTWLDFLED